MGSILPFAALEQRGVGFSMPNVRSEPFAYVALWNEGEVTLDTSILIKQLKLDIDHVLVFLGIMNRNA